MKKNIPYIICVLLLLTSCSQHKKKTVHKAPVITTTYPGEKIDSMLTAFHVSHTAKTHPDQAMKNRLEQNFQHGEKVKWEQGAGIYEAKFTTEGTKYKAYYDSDLNLIAYKYEINEEDLPAVVKNASVAKYPDYNFKKIIKIISGTDTFYLLEIKKDDTPKVELFLNHNGTVAPEKPQWK